MTAFLLTQSIYPRNDSYNATVLQIGQTKISIPVLYFSRSGCMRIIYCNRETMSESAAYVCDVGTYVNTKPAVDCPCLLGAHRPGLSVIPGRHRA